MDNANKLFVGCLPADITKDELQIVFQTYGAVQDIHIMSAKTSTGHACAFVTYAKRESGEDAITVLNDIYKIREGGPEVLPIKVSWAKPSGSGKGDGKGWNAGWNGGDQWGQQQAAGAWQGGQQWGGDWQGGAAGQQWGAGGGKGSWGGGGGGAGGSTGRLFVGNLPADIGEEALEYVFANYGKVLKIHVMAGRSKSGQSCAFVEYSKPEEAETAILTLHEKYEIRPGEGTIMVKAARNTRGPAPY